jgi:colanic acid/amylovoran biosynthesis glycosyltransferase
MVIFFLPVSRSFAKILIELGAPEHKVIVHHSALELGLFNKPTVRVRHVQEPVRFVTVARLVEKKGIEYAIDAFYIVSKQYPHIQYTIIGSGPRKKLLCDRIKRYGLENIVHLVGNLHHHAVIDILAFSDIMVLPCVTARDGNAEGIPNALKEAMALGLPVISTLQSGIQELVEQDVSGILVPERNSDALAKAMIQLLETPACWESMGAAGRAKIEADFDLDQHLTRLESYFYALCAPDVDVCCKS